MELLNCGHNFTINPITGRKIRVGGKVFLKLILEEGYAYHLEKNYLEKEQFEIYINDDDDEFNCEFYECVYGSEFL